MPGRRGHQHQSAAGTQELLRHANIQTTMNIYTQAVSDQKRDANSKVVEMVLSGAKIAPNSRSQRMGAECGFSQLQQTTSSHRRESALSLVAGGGFVPQALIDSVQR